jgi:hypothetical protein
LAVQFGRTGRSALLILCLNFMTTDAPGKDLGHFFHKESMLVLNQSRGVSVTKRCVISYENPDLLICVRCGQAPATVAGTGNDDRGWASQNWCALPIAQIHTSKSRYPHPAIPLGPQNYAKVIMTPHLVDTLVIH